MLRFLLYCSVFASALIFPRKNNGIKLISKLISKLRCEEEYPCSVNPDSIKTISDLEIENCELEAPYPDCEFETYERLILKDKQMRSLWTEYYNTSGEIYPEDVINKTDDYPLVP